MSHFQNSMWTAQGCISYPQYAPQPHPLSEPLNITCGVAHTVGHVERFITPYKGILNPFCKKNPALCQVLLVTTPKEHSSQNIVLEYQTNKCDPKPPL